MARADSKTDAMGFHENSILGNYKHLTKEVQYLYWKNKREFDDEIRQRNAWARAGFVSYPGSGLNYIGAEDATFMEDTDA